MKQEVDWADILEYPLTPVSLSLSHVDRTMQKAPKAALMIYMESRATMISPTYNYH